MRRRGRGNMYVIGMEPKLTHRTVEPLGRLSVRGSKPEPAAYLCDRKVSKSALYLAEVRRGRGLRVGFGFRTLLLT